MAHYSLRQAILPFAWYLIVPPPLHFTCHLSAKSQVCDEGVELGSSVRVSDDAETWFELLCSAHSC